MMGFGLRHRRGDPADVSVEAAQVNLASRVDAERGDVAERCRPAELVGVIHEPGGGRFASHSIDVQRERPDSTRAEVGEEVSASVCGAECACRDR